jgi:hypothetical protein
LNIISRAQPSNAFAIAPFAMTLAALICFDKDGETVHLSIVELAYIDIAICEFVGAIAFFLAISIVTLVFTAVSPLRLAITLDSALYELSFKSFF